MAVSVKAELARRNVRYKEAALAAGMSPSTLYKKLDRNNFSLDEAERVFGAIGMELRLVEKSSVCPESANL